MAARMNRTYKLRVYSIASGWILERLHIQTRIVDAFLFETWQDAIDFCEL